jgi:RHS repeat-associated protein
MCINTRGCSVALRRISISLCCLVASIGGGAQTSTPTAPAAATQAHDLAPQSDLTSVEFSAQPTVAEIFRARVFEEPLVPVGREPSTKENAALAAALVSYARRSSPDEFASLTTFLKEHPKSPWSAAVLTGLGIEYYNTAHYSLALDAWAQAWTLVKDAADMKGKAIGDRAIGELAYMYARLGRMHDLDELLKSAETRTFVGSTTEKISGARDGLWTMRNRPEVAFRCGPLALHRITRLTGMQSAADLVIFESASTTNGLSLQQVAELSKKVGLNYQMAFREQRGDFVIPSVVHWKVGHYAALVRQEGEKFLLEDPTFGNTVWATRAALEAETSGYFLIPPGLLPKGWRVVEGKEGEKVWGKGFCNNNDPKNTGPGDPAGGGCHGGGGGGGGGFPLPFPNSGMAASRVHLMLVNLNLIDTPVGYSPPIGPAVGFTVRYSHREAFQPTTFTYSNFGPKWTCDWISYITDNPQSLLADVNHYAQGGGTRTYTGFSTNTQTFVLQQYDQTRLTRIATNPIRYEMMSGNGSKLIFSQSDGSVGTVRKIFLTQIIDPFTNAITLAYDGSLRLTAITDAIGQVTSLSYSNATDTNKITRVTDPFGRFASFDYDTSGRLTNITDVIGITSRFTYEGSGDFIKALTTPYGTTSFTNGSSGTTRWLETLYPDGSRDRVEFNQSTGLGVPYSDPAATVPQGMSTFNEWLHARNTYYWSRSACATAYGDYTKAKVYHWLHTLDISTTAGILESTKEALEGRVWSDYAGQSAALIVGSTDQPRHVGRVLDDGSTQLYTYEYNQFGHVTNTVDPLGRTFSYLYETNGIDLLEARMTRAGQNQLLSKATYNAQHLPLTTTDAAGQTTTNTYNARGQLLTTSNPKGETTTYTYNTNGYLITVDGPLPGTNDTSVASYDAYGRIHAVTDMDGYSTTNDYDALDRVTNITLPDATFYQITYNRLEPSVLQDRAGRQTLLEYNPLGQLTKRTDPMGRVTQFQWCNCGAIKSLTDPMGRTTEWETDVQGRPVAKQYGDGSKVSYFYENSTSRQRQVIDEKLQVKQFTYNLDNTLRTMSFLNTAVATPAVTYTYDPDYERTASVTDGVGTTLYSYNPITGTPGFGAGQLASMDGPLPNDTITYGYDELGRGVATAINGVARTINYDAAGRVLGETNSLGSFAYAYDGTSRRRISETFPNGQTRTNAYGGNLQDRTLQRITHRIGTSPLSEFLLGRDIEANRITTWSQQTGASAPDLYSFGYDAADQLLSATVTNSGSLINTFGYTYDFAGNRLAEQVGASNYTATYNALNQISTSTAPGASRTNEWDAEDRLTAVNLGSQRTEFTYNADSQMVSIRLLTNGVQSSLRRFVWCGQELCEERDATGAIVAKRFFEQGVKTETGANVGSFFYTRDHLGSIREMTDSSGTVRARYAFDPYGRRTKIGGDLEADFGFAGMLWSPEAALAITWFRAYDPESGRWLSRDPLDNAEVQEGPNLYAYVGGDPVNQTDPIGLKGFSPLGGLKCLVILIEWAEKDLKHADYCMKQNDSAGKKCDRALRGSARSFLAKCRKALEDGQKKCNRGQPAIEKLSREYTSCSIEWCGNGECTSSFWDLKEKLAGGGNEIGRFRLDYKGICALEGVEARP